MNAVDYIPQRYKSVSEFLQRFALHPGRHGEWRLTDQIVGHIHGLPNSYGHLTATDGILCYIEQPRGRLYKGHIGWFVAENGEAIPAPLDGAGMNATNGKRERRRVSLADLNKVIL